MSTRESFWRAAGDPSSTSVSWSFQLHSNLFWGWFAVVVLSAQSLMEPFSHIYTLLSPACVSHFSFSFYNVYLFILYSWPIHVTRLNCITTLLPFWCAHFFFVISVSQIISCSLSIPCSLVVPGLLWSSSMDDSRILTLGTARSLLVDSSVCDSRIAETTKDHIFLGMTCEDGEGEYVCSSQP